jgi:hypothetical protein
VSVQRVPASLFIGAARGAPLDAQVAVLPRTNAGLVRVSIRLESGADWVLELEPGPAAYLAGGLTFQSGVKLA